MWLDGEPGDEGTGDHGADLDLREESVGAFRPLSTPSLHLNGTVADLAVWDALPTTMSLDDMAKALAGGQSPLLVEPQNLVRYRPLERAEQLSCYVTGIGFSGSMLFGDHPKLQLPWSFWSDVEAPVAFNPAWARNSTITIGAGLVQ